MAAAESSLGKSAELQARKELAEKVYAALAKAIPEPKAELHYGSVYELLTSVMLSAQATDKSVNAVTPELFRLAPTPAKMLEHQGETHHRGSGNPRLGVWRQCAGDH